MAAKPDPKRPPRVMRLELATGRGRRAGLYGKRNSWPANGCCPATVPFPCPSWWGGTPGKGWQVWSIPFAVPYAKQPLLLGTRLVVPGRKGIFVFDSLSGRFLYQVADLYLGDPEARNLLNYYGFLTRLEDGVYAGSSSGSLQFLGIPSD